MGLTNFWKIRNVSTDETEWNKPMDLAESQKGSHFRAGKYSQSKEEGSLKTVDWIKNLSMKQMPPFAPHDLLTHHPQILHS